MNNKYYIFVENNCIVLVKTDCLNNELSRHTYNLKPTNRIQLTGKTYSVILDLMKRLMKNIK